VLGVSAQLVKHGSTSTSLRLGPKDVVTKLSRHGENFARPDDMRCHNVSAALALRDGVPSRSRRWNLTASRLTYRILIHRVMCPLQIMSPCLCHCDTRLQVTDCQQQHSQNKLPFNLLSFFFDFLLFNAM
jgi:hypothetical protein